MFHHGFRPWSSRPSPLQKLAWQRCDPLGLVTTCYNRNKQLDFPFSLQLEVGGSKGLSMSVIFLWNALVRLRLNTRCRHVFYFIFYCVDHWKRFHAFLIKHCLHEPPHDLAVCWPLPTLALVPTTIFPTLQTRCGRNTHTDSDGFVLGNSTDHSNYLIRGAGEDIAQQMNYRQRWMRKCFQSTRIVPHLQKVNSIIFKSSEDHEDWFSMEWRT